MKKRCTIKKSFDELLEKIRTERQRILENLKESEDENFSGNKYLTKKQVAEIWGCSEKTIERWVKSGLLFQKQIPGGRSVRYRKSDLENLLEGWNQNEG